MRDHVLRIHELVYRRSRYDDPDVPQLQGDSPGAALASVPWQHGGSWALTHDMDMDGVPDAFDHFFGPGAYAPGA